MSDQGEFENKTDLADLLNERERDHKLASAKRWSKWGEVTSKKGQRRGTPEDRAILKERVREEMINDLGPTSRWRVRGEVWQRAGHAVERWNLDKEDSLVKTMVERWNELESFLREEPEPRSIRHAFDTMGGTVANYYGRVLVKTRHENEILRILIEAAKGEDIYPWAVLSRVLEAPSAWTRPELMEAVFLSTDKPTTNLFSTRILRGYQFLGEQEKEIWPLWWVLEAQKSYAQFPEFMQQLVEVLQHIRPEVILAQWELIEKYANNTWELVLKYRPEVWEQLNKERRAQLLGNTHKEVRVTALKTAGRKLG